MFQMIPKFDIRWLILRIIHFNLNCLMNSFILFYPILRIYVFNCWFIWIRSVFYQIAHEDLLFKMLKLLLKIFSVFIWHIQLACTVINHMCHFNEILNILLSNYVLFTLRCNTVLIICHWINIVIFITFHTWWILLC